MQNNNSLEDIINNLPECEYDPWDFLNFSQEIFHISSEGNIRQISVMSKEGQEVLRKINNDR